MGISRVCRNIFDNGYQWMTEHPRAFKAVGVAAAVLGVSTLTAATIAPTLIIGARLLTGAALLGSLSVIQHRYGEYLFPIPHDMKDHAFTPCECEGGRLIYEGDVPVLIIESSDPYSAGQTEGYLCASALSHMMQKVKPLQHDEVGQPDIEECQEILKEIQDSLPERHLLEMQGIVDGYNRWAEEYPWMFPAKMTIEDLIFLNLMPDRSYGFPENQEEKEARQKLEKRGQEMYEKMMNVNFKMMKEIDLSNIPSNSNSAPIFGCTSIVVKREDGITFARNLDWTSFGCFGKYSLVIKRQGGPSHEASTVVSIPGCVGTLTGMNKQGLCLAINVNNSSGLHPSETPQGKLPILFHARRCLEECSTVEEVEAFIKENPPLGPYFLTVADPNKGKVFYLTSQEQKTGQVDGTSTDDEPTLITHNHRPSTHANVIEIRVKDTAIARARRQGNEDPKQWLSLVSMDTTIHAVVMKPGSSMQVAFNNTHAGADPLHFVSIS